MKNDLFNENAQEVEEVMTPRKSAVHLQQVRNMAKVFNQRRQSLGFSQSQMSQSFNAFNDPDLNDLALARLERLDITPRSAAKIRPALERWLNETELKFSERVLS